MPKCPDLPCADCGKLLWRGTTSLPEGQARCRPCRASTKAATCTSCGEPFVAIAYTRGGVRRTPTLCSPTCVGAARTRAPRECQVCGASYIGPTRNRTCGWSCGALLGAGRGPTCELPSDHPVIVLMRASRLTERDCSICGLAYMPTGSTSTLCGDDCRKVRDRRRWSEKEHRRRAKLVKAYVAPVNRRAIFERDSWMCGICHEPIDPACDAPDLMSASIDHVIPLARGGTHEPANVQAAHWICNVRKRDTMPSPRGEHPGVGVPPDRSLRLASL
jgi:5-methylcytosine-specific restriction endonuclease McrA